MLNMCCLILLSLSICSHRLFVSLLHGIRLVLSWVISKLNSYCFKKAFTRSFHFLILVLSNLMYQLNVDPVRLSWKKNISASYHYRSFQPFYCSMIEDGCLGILVWYTWWSPTLWTPSAPQCLEPNKLQLLIQGHLNYFL